MTGDEAQDAEAKVVVPATSGVRIVVGTPDTHTEELKRQLSAKLGAAFGEIQATDNLLDLLWKSPGRPALLIVVGHLEKRTVAGREEMFIQLPGGQWLSAEPITSRHERSGEWDQPRTLVLLMACGSGATELSTLNDFVTALTAAGASAVISTECMIFSRLVARFASEVTDALWNDEPLGKAIQAFNRRMVQAGNPLAFVFNCLGDAELTLAK